MTNERMHPVVARTARELKVTEAEIRRLARKPCVRRPRRPGANPLEPRCHEIPFGGPWCRPCSAHYAIEHEKADEKADAKDDS